ncbi:MAG: hypothetical protein JKX88_01695 [Marinicaulis sp.]|nr:hypothetical protein [Marinicaulis sp.]
MPEAGIRRLEFVVMAVASIEKLANKIIGKPSGEARHIRALIPGNTILVVKPCES